MNDRQRNKYDSHLAVRTLCAKDTSLALTSSLPAWRPLYDRVLAKISYADACVLIQISDLTGITKAKNDARATLIANILETAGALCTLALLREDSVLDAKADILPSDLNALADSLVDDKATELLELARAIPAPAPDSTAPGLADVGLTEGKLDLLETRIETYNLLLGTPRGARGTKTAATENLQQTMDEIDRLLEKGLDKLALQFTGTSFHQEYLLARDPVAVAKSKPAVEPPAPTP
jgi:hypothetical protein